MQTQTRNILAAATAGVLVGAFATAMIMSNQVRRDDMHAAGAPASPGINPDDVVAVLDADRTGRLTGAGRPPAAGRESAPRGPARPALIDPSIPTLSAGRSDILDELRGRRLTVPVQGLERSTLVQSFNDPRSGARRHEAIDILAPRNTPVLAVEDGTVARLFSSKAGGITIYQYDPSGAYVYYYAHLERYASGLEEGGTIRRGQVIGYVGTTGNAPPNTPHLHFAIFELDEPKRWWEGTPVDPFLVLR